MEQQLTNADLLIAIDRLRREVEKLKPTKSAYMTRELVQAETGWNERKASDVMREIGIIEGTKCIRRGAFERWMAERTPRTRYNIQDGVPEIKRRRT